MICDDCKKEVSDIAVHVIRNEKIKGVCARCYCQWARKTFLLTEDDALRYTPTVGDLTQLDLWGDE
jgi:protein-arginine kinase activator protein McsA